MLVTMLRIFNYTIMDYRRRVLLISIIVLLICLVFHVKFYYWVVSDKKHGLVLLANNRWLDKWEVPTNQSVTANETNLIKNQGNGNITSSSLENGTEHGRLNSSSLQNGIEKNRLISSSLQNATEKSRLVSSSLQNGIKKGRLISSLSHNGTETTTSLILSSLQNGTKMSSNSPEIRLKDGNVLILYWHRSDGRDQTLPDPFFENCIVTMNKDLMAECQAVVFDFQILPTFGRLPHAWQIPYRDSDQVFVWRGGEAPGAIIHMRGLNLQAYPVHFFNWTLSPRRDSDVYQPYSTIEDVLNRVEVGKDVVDQIIAHKSDKLAIWIVSNCDATSGARARMAYSDALIDAGLRLERFGRCFPSSREIPGDWGNLKVVQEAVRPYKFYMSFENAHHCKDYFTEKFWYNALANDAVPIVWGPNKEDVEAVAPVGSFIHSDDFASPEALVDYINYLDNNVTSYREYFKWREIATKPQKDPNDTRMDALASLCKALKERRPYKTIPSIHDFFVASNPSECYD